MKDRSKYLYGKKAKGKDYLYFRFPNGKLASLPADQGSAAFRLAYDECIRSMAPTAPRERIVTPHAETLAAAIAIYRDSLHFRKLRPSTQRHYEAAMRRWYENLGAARLADIDGDAVNIHTEEVAKRPHQKTGALTSGSAADFDIFVLSNIWKVCKKYPQFKLKGRANPTEDADRHYKLQQSYRPWPREAQRAFMEGSAPKNVKLGYLLLRFTVQRGGDCVRMLWDDFDAKAKTIVVRPEKTHGEVDPLPKVCKCPKPLLRALNAAPRVADTILVSERGTPYASRATLSNAIRLELRRLGFSKKGERGLSMHGLRVTSASEIGTLAGVGSRGLQKVGHWHTESMAAKYAQHANDVRTNADVIAIWDEELDRQAATERRAQARRAKIKVVASNEPGALPARKKRVA